MSSTKGLHPRLKARMNSTQVGLFENKQKEGNSENVENGGELEKGSVKAGSGRKFKEPQDKIVDEAIAIAPPEPVSVSEICQRVKSTLKEGIPSVYVQGEIADFKGVHRSGHLYCSLKDEKAQIRMVMWKGALEKVPFQVKGGLEVIVRGKLDFYAGSGSLQISVDRMEPVGVGALQLKFEQLKEKLEAEGLFDEARKRPIPTVCWRVGLVTGKSTAALQDMLRIFKQRFPLAEIYLFHSAVQGPKAPEQIVGALSQANAFSKKKKLDAIIVGRGGGSYEDLFCFNDESIARAIVASEIPVVSAIGHEIDYTIADFVADKRSATPTHAAQEVVPDIQQWFDRLEDLRNFFPEKVYDLIHEQQERVDAYYDRLVHMAPHKRIERQREGLEMRRSRLTDLMRSRLSAVQAELSEKAAVLDALSPLKVFERGYSLVKTPAAKALKSVEQVKKGEQIQILVQDGQIDAQVTDKKSTLES